MFHDQRWWLDDVSDLLVKSDELPLIVNFVTTFFLFDFYWLYLKNFLASVNHTATYSHHFIKLAVFWTSFTLLTLYISLCQKALLSAFTSKRLYQKIRVLGIRRHHNMRLCSNVKLYYINATLKSWWHSDHFYRAAGLTQITVFNLFKTGHTKLSWR